MMFTWNQGIDLPKKLPVAFSYKMIVDSLNMKTNIVNSGQMCFDFCSGYALDCVFKEYCHCLEFWNDLPDMDDFEENHTESKNDIKRSQNDAFSADGEDDLPF